MRVNQTEDASDRVGSEQWENEGGRYPPPPIVVDEHARWERALARHWHAYVPSEETKVRAETERTRAQKPNGISSSVPRKR